MRMNFYLLFFAMLLFQIIQGIIDKKSEDGYKVKLHSTLEYYSYLAH